MKMRPTTLSLLIGLVALSSACSYTLRRPPPPDAPKFAGSPMPLRVVVVQTGDSDNGGERLIRKRRRGDRSDGSAVARAVAAALARTGLFRDVDDGAAASSDRDVVVQVTQTQDHAREAIFPYAVPLCVPLIFGCFPVFHLSDTYVSKLNATLNVGRSYSVVGGVSIDCRAPLGCTGPVLEAHAAALQVSADMIAADFLKDADFYRGLAHAAEAGANAQRPASDGTPRAAAAEQSWWKPSDSGGAGH
jgi:hypothetical protein